MIILTSKLIPIVKTPITEAYKNIILQANNPDIMKILLPYYITLKFSTDDNLSYLDIIPYQNLSFFDYKYIITNLFDEKRFETIFQDMLTAGYFVIINLDEYYMPGTNSYKKIHRFSELLIIGFDESISKFKLVYKEDNNFILLSVPYMILMQSLFILIKVPKHKEKICFIKSHPINTTIDKDKLKSKLRFHIGLENIQTGIYGLQIYDRLSELVQIAQSDNYPNLVRCFNTLREYTQLWISKLSYLSSNEIIVNSEVIMLFQKIDDIVHDIYSNLDSLLNKKSILINNILTIKNIENQAYQLLIDLL